MSKKVLSFIHGEQVHVAPETRVIPAEEFSSLADASEVLEKVQADARQYREEMVAEAEKEREQARQEGFKVGLETWTGHIAELEAEIQRVHDELRKLVVSMSMQAAKKIVGKQLELKEETIVDIVRNVLKTVSEHRVVTVHVSPDDLDILEKHRPELREVFERLESLALMPRNDVESGGCIVETESGIINAEIKYQWERLQNAIDTLMRDSEKKEAEEKQAKK